MTAHAMSGGQLTLGVKLRDDATLANYIAMPDQGALLDSLSALCEQRGEAVLYLHGPGQTGKSHLLQACCQAVGEGALYLPLTEIRHYDPDEVLTGLAGMRLLCLDDLDAIAGDAGWEQALFDLFNRARAQGCALLLAAQQPPASLSLGLPDLASRFAWGPVFALPALDDAHLDELLMQRAALRGISMPAEVATYLTSRSARGPADLVAVLETLDQASLEAQRKLSIPFVKAAMGW